MKNILIALLGLATFADYSFADELELLQPKTMINGYYKAGSRPDEQALGGYGACENLPKKIVENLPGTKGEVNLIALPSERTPFWNRYLGFRLLLINRTAFEHSFAAIDSCLKMICEAQDQNGEWKPIELMPHSFCGNSNHNVYLPSDHYWEFSVPIYSGPFKTKLRYSLQSTQTIYSNEFDGSINPEQFHNPESKVMRLPIEQLKSTVTSD